MQRLHEADVPLRFALLQFDELRSARRFRQVVAFGFLFAQQSCLADPFVRQEQVDGQIGFIGEGCCEIMACPRKGRCRSDDCNATDDGP